MRARLVVLVLVIAVLSSSSAFGARIFGDLKMDGKPVPAGVRMKITRLITDGGKTKPAAGPVDSTVTDKFGSYKLTVKDEGKCSLAVSYDKQVATLDVFSYKEATRYDLILEKKDGKLSVRRK